MILMDAMLHLQLESMQWVRMEEGLMVDLYTWLLFTRASMKRG